MSMARSRSSRPTIFLTIFLKKPGLGVTSAALRKVPTYSNCEGSKISGGLESASLAGHDHRTPNTSTINPTHTRRFFEFAIRPKIHPSEKVERSTNAEPVAVDVQSANRVGLVQQIMDIAETTLHADLADVVASSYFPKAIVLTGTDQFVIFLAIGRTDFKIVLGPEERAEVRALGSNVQQRADDKLLHRQRHGDKEIPLQRGWKNGADSVSETLAGRQLDFVALHLPINVCIVPPGVSRQIE